MEKRHLLEFVINFRELEAIYSPVLLLNLIKPLLTSLKTMRVFVHIRNMACEHSIESKASSYAQCNAKAPLQGESRLQNALT